MVLINFNKNRKIMKNVKSLFLMSIGVWLFAVCISCNAININPDDPRVQKTFDLPSFNAVRAYSGVKVVYTQSASKQTVKVDVVEKILPYLVVKNSGGELVLGLDFEKAGRVTMTGNPVTVYVSAPEINRLSVSSGASIKVDKDLRVDDDLLMEASSGAMISIEDVRASGFSMDLSSGSSVKVGNVSVRSLTISTSSGSMVNLDNVSCTSSNVSSSSGSSVSLRGKCGGVAHYDISSASSVKAADFVASDVNAQASSGSSLKCHAAKSITAEASSGAKIRYKGRPADVNADKSDVKRL